MLAPDIFDDRLVKRRARRFDGFRLHHAVERYDRRFRCAAADIDDHMAVRAVHVQTRADRRGDRRGDKIHFSSARLDDGIHNGALLHAGDAARHAHEHARAEEAEARHAADEFAQHFAGHVVIGDNARGDGMDGYKVPRRAAEHFPRILADLEHAAGRTVDRNDCRLAQANADTGDIEDGRIGAEIDGNIFFDDGGQNRHSQIPFKSKAIKFFCYSSRWQASAAPRTLTAPAVSSMRAHSESVEPVVMTSSISRILLPRTASALRTT